MGVGNVDCLAAERAPYWVAKLDPASDNATKWHCIMAAQKNDTTESHYKNLSGGRWEMPRWRFLDDPVCRWWQRRSGGDWGHMCTAAASCPPFGKETRTLHTTLLIRSFINVIVCIFIQRKNPRMCGQECVCALTCKRCKSEETATSELWETFNFIYRNFRGDSVSATYRSQN